MSLLVERMNAVLLIASRVFGRRAERATKNSPSIGCLPDVVEADLTDIVVELRGERFARNADQKVCLVLEFAIRGQLPAQVVTTADVWLIISATGGGPQNLTISLSLQYDGIQAELPTAVLQQLDSRIQQILQPLLTTPINLPLQVLFGSTAEIVPLQLEGNPELTIGGNTNGSFRTLAIGLAITLGQPVDREHFRTNYLPPVLLPAWATSVS